MVKCRFSLLFPCLLFLLSGCDKASGDALDEALSFRARAQTQPCSFQAEITADYGTHLSTFTLDCTADPDGGLGFTVTEPESIAGITGTVDSTSGNLTFDDAALGFPLLAGPRLSPAAAPEVLLTAWRSGFISTCGWEADNLRLTIDTLLDSKTLRTETWLDRENLLPICAELCYNGEDVLTIRFAQFQFPES